jgi:hypothetical protein
MPTLMSAITQPSFTGITTHALSARMQVTSGAIRKTPLLAPSGMTTSLNTNFSMSANDWNSPHGTDDVRPAAHLHGSPDLAVGVDDVGHAHQHGHQQRKRLQHDETDGDE